MLTFEGKISLDTLKYLTRFLFWKQELKSIVESFELNYTT